MLSALEHPGVVQDYLDKECSLGRMLGPFPKAAFGYLTTLQVSPFGVIPKGHNTGR